MSKPTLYHSEICTVLLRSLLLATLVKLLTVHYPRKSVNFVTGEDLRFAFCLSVFWPSRMSGPCANKNGNNISSITDLDISI